jgi:hypothetical protein
LHCRVAQQGRGAFNGKLRIVVNDRFSIAELNDESRIQLSNGFSFRSKVHAWVDDPHRTISPISERDLALEPRVEQRQTIP